MAYRLAELGEKNKAPELALRLKYAGVPTERIAIVDGLAPALDQALSEANNGRIYALPTYTALLELRQELAGRGLTSRYKPASTR